MAEDRIAEVSAELEGVVSPANEGGRRILPLNPFALPIETNARFVLTWLGCAMVAVATMSFIWRAFTVPLADPFSAQSPGAVARRQFAIDRTRELLRGNAHSVWAAEGTTWMLCCGGIMLLLAGAYLMYRNHVSLVSFSEDLAAAGDDVDPGVAREIAELSARAGVSPVPRIYRCTAKQESCQAAAMGLRGNYVLRIDDGCTPLLKQDREGFAALVLHELAHIVNGDIGRGYFAAYLWLFTSCLTVFPFFGCALVLLVRGQWRDFSLMRALVWDLPLFLLVFAQMSVSLNAGGLMYAQLLRVRELYADFRAASWGATDALRRIFRRAHPRPRMAGIARRPPRPRGFLARQLEHQRLHPPVNDRLDTLDDPTALYKLQFSHSFEIGVVTAWLIHGVTKLVSPFAMMIATQVSWTEGKPLWVFLAITTLACAAAAAAVAPVLGRQAQRDSLARLSDARLPLGAGGAIVIFTLGYEFGAVFWPGDMTSMSLRLVFEPLWFVFSFASVFIWLTLTCFFANEWIGSGAGHTLSSSRQRAVDGVSALVLLAVLLSSTCAREAIHGSFGVGGTAGLLKASAGCAVIAGVILVGAFLVGCIWGFARRPRCWSCDTIVEGFTTVGRQCRCCGVDLAPWFYLPASVMTEEPAG